MTIVIRPGAAGDDYRFEVLLRHLNRALHKPLFEHDPVLRVIDDAGAGSRRAGPRLHPVSGGGGQDCESVRCPVPGSEPHADTSGAWIEYSDAAI